MRTRRTSMVAGAAVALAMLVLAAACSSRGAESRRGGGSGVGTGTGGSGGGTGTGSGAGTGAGSAEVRGGDGEAIEHRQACGEVTAIWSGQRSEGRDEYERLRFVWPGTGVELPFASGEMYPPYWSFDIFAPDCRHVLLLRSYTGPYEVVAIERLAAFLKGGAADHVLRGRPGESGAVSAGAWVSAREVSYLWGCCDPPVPLRFVLPEGR